MKAFGLQKNTVIRWKDVVYRIERVGDKQLVLERMEDGSMVVTQKDELHQDYLQSKLSFEDPELNLLEEKIQHKRLSDFSEPIQQETKRRYGYVQALIHQGHIVFTKPSIEPLIQEIAQIIGDKQPPSSTSCYRWYKKYKQANDIRALIPAQHRKGRTPAQLTPIAQKILIDTVDMAYKQSPQASIKNIYASYIGALSIENATRGCLNQIHIPSERSFYRIMAQFGAYELIESKYGKAAAERKFRIVTGKVETSRILERVEIDHTPLDLFIVNAKTMMPMGRPNLTVCIDHFSRMPLGYYISFQSPSTACVIGALRHSILPKQAVTEGVPDLVIHHIWNSFGVPELLVVDNGFEFHSDDLASIAMDLGMGIQFCPKREPWHKGTIERFLKTINYSFASQMPGASFARWHLRGDYDPLKDMVIEFEDFKKIFEKWILDIYAQDIHRMIKTTPWSKWQAGLNQTEPKLPLSIEALNRIIGKTASRSLRKDGVLLHGIRYNNHALGAVLRKYGTKVEVRVVYDPEDLGCIQVYTPEDVEPISVMALDAEYASGLSEIQNDYIQRKLRDDGKNSHDSDSLSMAKYELSQAIQGLIEHKKLRHNKRGSKLSGISSNKPQSEILKASKPDQKPRLSPSAKTLNHPIEAFELLGKLPTYSTKGAAR